MNKENCALKLVDEIILFIQLKKYVNLKVAITEMCQKDSLGIGRGSLGFCGAHGYYHCQILNRAFS